MLSRRLLSNMSTYCFPSILPSISAIFPTPSQPMQPHTMIFPPPNFTVCCMSFSPTVSPFLFHTYCCPSDPYLLILVSSDHITLFQSSMVHSLYFKANAKRAFF